MQNKLMFSFLGVCCLFLLSTIAIAIDFNPGSYEITSQVEMPGMPAGTIPPQTIVQCMTKEDPIPKSDAAAQGCEIKNLKETSNTVSWEMDCLVQGQKMSSQGEVRYKADSFEGSIIMNMGPQAGNMTVNTKIMGKRVGDCLNKE